MVHTSSHNAHVDWWACVDLVPHQHVQLLVDVLVLAESSGFEGAKVVAVVGVSEASHLDPELHVHVHHLAIAFVEDLVELLALTVLLVELDALDHAEDLVGVIVEFQNLVALEVVALVAVEVLLLLVVFGGDLVELGVVALVAADVLLVVLVVVALVELVELDVLSIVVVAAVEVALGGLDMVVVIVEHVHDPLAVLVVEDVLLDVHLVLACVQGEDEWDARTELVHSVDLDAPDLVGNQLHTDCQKQEHVGPTVVERAASERCSPRAID